MITTQKINWGKGFSAVKMMFMAILAGIGFTANAQHCLTDKINYDILKQNIELFKQHEALYKNVPSASSNKRATKYIIPVVFHVIHTNGEENISKAQIEDQIRILNEDYSFTNPNKSSIRSIFLGVAANMEIEFRLATIDPQGNCTDGINRVYSSKGINAGDAVKTLPMARWPHNKYLNIWLVSSINSAGSEGTILGYAYFPSTSAEVTFSALDGVICRADYVGSIGTSNLSKAGRVLTHEIGHYLGLLHPFQDSCFGGDHCDDTPPVISTFTNANCAILNSCHNDTPDLPDQFENYMDYSRGECQAMFTLDQKDIVYNTFTNFAHRASLVSMENLIATGVVTQNVAPKAGFVASATTICAGKSVTFSQAACYNTVSSRTWTFEGGSITTSTSTSPVVTYPTPGLYKVSLTVTNSNGSNTLERDQYIQVLPSEAIDKGYLRETFENPEFQNADGWKVTMENGAYTFKRVVGVAYDGNASLMADIKTPTAISKGLKYRIVSPRVDLRPLAGLGPKLSFMCAYAKPNASSKETLRVYSSDDCGNTWIQRYFRQDANLFSVTQPNPAFVPTTKAEWRQHTIALNGLQTQPNIQFMIEIESDGGGNVYIDNINVSQFNTSIEQVTVGTGLELYPVPSKNEVNLMFETGIAGDAVIEIKNMLGQVVMTTVRSVGQGEQQVNLQFDNQITSGIYFVSVKIGTQTFINKLIVENK